MIMNERQYRITKAEVGRFEKAVSGIDGETVGLDPLLRKAMRESLESMLEDLLQQVAEYDALRDGHVDVIELTSLGDLPVALVRARIASGATQKELGRRLGLREQQIQRYEASLYAGASLRRMQQVADALELAIPMRVVLPNRDVDGLDQADSEPSGRVAAVG